jgi:lysophospholipase L1-like esterase
MGFMIFHHSRVLQSHAPLDLVVLLLGTNDLKRRFSAPPCDIAAGAGALMDIISSSEIDGIHFDEKDHRALGQALALEVRRLLLRG